MTAALEVGEWSAARRSRTLPPRRTRYPFYRRLGGPQGRSGRAENLAPHRDSIPDRPVRSHSLYRLSYPVYLCTILYIINRILIFTPTRCVIHCCYLHGVQPYRYLFSTYPIGDVTYKKLFNIRNTVHKSRF